MVSTERAANRPERTTYRITDPGRTTLRDWLSVMLSTPAPEYPEFPAALSFLPNLAPADALGALHTRIGHLEQRLSAIEAEIAHVVAILPALFAVESEYQRKVLQAELDYVRGLIEQLRDGRITWPIVDAGG